MGSPNAVDGSRYKGVGCLASLELKLRPMPQVLRDTPRKKEGSPPERHRLGLLEQLVLAETPQVLLEIGVFLSVKLRVPRCE